MRRAHAGRPRGRRPRALRDTGGQCRAQPRPLPPPLPGSALPRGDRCSGARPCCARLTLQAAAASGSQDVCRREGVAGRRGAGRRGRSSLTGPSTDVTARPVSSRPQVCRTPRLADLVSPSPGRRPPQGPGSGSHSAAPRGPPGKQGGLWAAPPARGPGDGAPAPLLCWGEAACRQRPQQPPATHFPQPTAAVAGPLAALGQPTALSRSPRGAHRAGGEARGGPLENSSLRGGQGLPAERREGPELGHMEACLSSVHPLAPLGGRARGQVGERTPVGTVGVVGRAQVDAGQGGRCGSERPPPGSRAGG